jgi:hypothetical protein
MLDLLLDIENQREDLEKRRKHAVEHINKLKKNSKNGFVPDGLLNMQYRTLKTGTGQLNKKLSEFGKEMEVYRKLNMAMSVDENNPYERYEPEIVVRGEIGPDVQIYGPNGRFRDNLCLKNVSIKLDRKTGEFSIHPLKLSRD